MHEFYPIFETWNTKQKVSQVANNIMVSWPQTKRSLIESQANMVNTDKAQNGFLTCLI